MSADEQYQVEQDAFFKDYNEQINKWYKEDKNKKSEWKTKLKGLINVSGLYRFLEEGNESWQPIGIFDIEKIDNSSSERERCKLINEQEEYKWMVYERVGHIDEIRSVDHWYVWQQTTSMEGDSYSGFLLLPLKNGKYFKVSYSC